MRAAVDDLFRQGQLLGFGVPATGVLVETLLDRAADGDMAEAEAAIKRLATAPADEGSVVRDIWLLRSRTLLARARGDMVAYHVPHHRLVGAHPTVPGGPRRPAVRIPAAWVGRRHRYSGCDQAAKNNLADPSVRPAIRRYPRVGHHGDLVYVRSFREE
jgi:hypothetical protein